MDDLIYRDDLLQKFLIHISQKGLSNKNLKNYKSDISKFLNWLNQSISSISPTTSELYRKYLLTSESSPLTINRIFSTLRHFARFLLESQILDFDFMEGVQNEAVTKESKLLHPSILSEFVKHLEENKVSKNTIKSYLSDVKQFIFWLESNNGNPDYRS